MTVVVTGGAGFIGSHLCEKLLDKGYNVMALDDFNGYYSPQLKAHNLNMVNATADDAEGDFDFVRGSLFEESAVQQFPNDPEYVFHLAGLGGVRRSMDNPDDYFRRNVYSTSRMYDYFDEAGKYILASSSSIYGTVDREELPVEENHTASPESPYALSKVQMEEMTWVLSDLYGFDYSILRYFSVYGPRQRPDQIFTKFISMALKGKKLPVYGDGEQSRDFTHVDDIVRGTHLAADKGGGVYNLGNSHSVTVNEVVSAISDSLGEDVTREYVEASEDEPPVTLADISRARDEIGYSPIVRFDKGVDSCVAWCRMMVEEGLL